MRCRYLWSTPSHLIAISGFILHQRSVSPARSIFAALMGMLTNIIRLVMMNKCFQTIYDCGERFGLWDNTIRKWIWWSSRESLTWFRIRRATSQPHCTDRMDKKMGLASQERTCARWVCASPESIKIEIIACVCVFKALTSNLCCSSLPTTNDIIGNSQRARIVSHKSPTRVLSVGDNPTIPQSRTFWFRAAVCLMFGMQRAPLQDIDCAG